MITPEIQTSPLDADEAPVGMERRLAHGATAFAKTANAVLNGLSDAAGVTPRVEKNPYGLVAVAMATGYVAGGGLFTPLSTRLLGLAVKLAAVPAVRDRILDVAESALDGLLATPGRNSRNAPEVAP
jgi:hypothetical protein